MRAPPPAGGGRVHAAPPRPEPERRPGTPPDADAQLTHPREVFRQAFVPLFLGLSIASWVWTEAITGALAAASIRLDALSAVYLTLLLAVWIAEQAVPERAEWNYHLFSEVRGWARLGRDLLYLFVLTQVSAQLVARTSKWISSTLAAFGFGPGLPGAPWPVAAPFAVRVLLAFLLVELCSYWIHRVSHHFEPLWRFHSTHHAAAELNAFKSLRLHPIDNVAAAVARGAPLVLLGVGLEETLAVTYFGSALSLLSHANVSLPVGRLGWLVNYPRFHAVHHSVVLEESRSNYGCHTVLWDRVFGTFRGEARAGTVVGLDDRGPRTLWQELAWPFYRSVT